MSGCDQKLKVYDLLDGSLSVPEATAFRSHLASCPECRAFYEAEQRRAVRLHAALSAPIPEFAVVRSPAAAARSVRRVPFSRSFSRLAALLALLFGLAAFAAVAVVVIRASSGRTKGNQQPAAGILHDEAPAGSYTEGRAKVPEGSVRTTGSGRATEDRAKASLPSAATGSRPSATSQPATSPSATSYPPQAAGQSAPAETNVWTCSDTNGHASTGANWSLGMPTAEQTVLLSTNSCADIYWDAPATVAAWIQTPGYTGTVTFATQYPHIPGATFTNFTVTGDVDLQGGRWTHPLSLDSGATVLQPARVQAQEVYRLAVTIGGDCRLGTDAAINVTGRGYTTGNTGGAYKPCHAGIYDAVSAGNLCYGDARRPEDIGYGSAQNGSDLASKRAAGGGAVRLAVAGALVVDGRIVADGAVGDGAGAGGSVWVSASSISGSGSVTAVGPAGSKTDGGGFGGAGGRIAFWTSSPVVPGRPFVSASVVNNRSNAGGCGTIFLRDSTMTHGVLIVDNLLNRSVARTSAVTSVTTNGDWMFDAIRLGGVVTLDVPVGTRLYLPDGFRSVTSTNDSCVSALVYHGGELDLGPSGEQPLAGGWYFRTAVDYKLKAAVRMPAFETAWIDLSGQSLTVDAFLFGRQKVRPGIYSVTSLDVDGFLHDSVGGGILAVKGRGFYIIVL